MKKRFTNVVLTLWLLINTAFLFAGWGTRGFWLYEHRSKKGGFDEDFNWDNYLTVKYIETPVNNISLTSIIDYDITEFLIFGFLPILIILGIRYIKKEKTV